MDFRNRLVKELVRNGYSEKDGKKIWNIANRSFLYMTPELAKAFLAIRKHPRYKKIIIEVEKELIGKNSEKFIGKMLHNPFNLIDMGSGEGEKAIAFISSLKGKGHLRYIPVNSHSYLAELASNNVKKEKFKNVEECIPKVACLDELDEISGMVRNREYRNNVVLLLGSILSSFEIHDYLFKLSHAMFEGDCLIIGNGIRKGDRIVNVETYKHDTFKNWLVHLIKGLGFIEGEFEYDARAANERIEGLYTLKKGKEISYNGKKIELKKGDEIVVAYLYKYFEKELEEICKKYFGEVKLVKDKEEEQALVFCFK